MRDSISTNDRGHEDKKGDGIIKHFNGYDIWNHPYANRCVNVKELHAQSRREIWSLSDCNWTRSHNHLVCKRTLNHLAKLAKWLSRVVSTTIECGFTLKRERDMTRTYSQRHRTDKYSQHISIIWPLWLQISRLLGASSFLTFRQL